ncbi:SDR family NAD(P)-dependent oxidoreductase [Winogradskyella ursingii]|uniref:SDR family NAD(P)-dependent oxidoreductase n=1 Tax=Winogradskyella ursingii TaxID=2686079 RepID=UPI0015CA207F|nr:SDR family NAD(P)-dependent oxidoreductase [Winogradskyella ursingii]
MVYSESGANIALREARLTTLYTGSVVLHFDATFSSLNRNEGKILNLGSVAGFQPGPLMGVYHATKAYVVSL